MQYCVSLKNLYDISLQPHDFLQHQGQRGRGGAGRWEDECAFLSQMTISSVVGHGERRNSAQSAQHVHYFLAMFGHCLVGLQPHQITHLHMAELTKNGKKNKTSSKTPQSARNKDTKFWEFSKLNIFHGNWWDFTNIKLSSRKIKTLNHNWEQRCKIL